MIRTGKQLSRRPWSELDDEMIHHIDGIIVTDVETRGMYFCMHSPVDFLISSNINCPTDKGFVWPKLVIENFEIHRTKKGEALYVTDGIVKDRKLQLTLQNGKIQDSGFAMAVLLDHLQLDSLYICNVAVDTPIKLTNCSVKKLKIRNCDNVDFVIKNTTIETTELWNCHNVKFDDPTIQPVYYPSQDHGQIKASVAINISIDGVLYEVQAANLIPLPFTIPVALPPAKLAEIPVLK